MVNPTQFRALAPWLELREWPDIEKRTLRSRLRVLRVYLTKPQDDTQETAHETQTRLARIREALELVGLALHYDHTAWEQFEVLEVQPAEYKHWHQFGDPDDLEPRYELAFDVAHENQVFERWFDRVCEADVFAWDMHLCEKLLQFPPQILSAQYHAAIVRMKELVGSAFDASYRLELQFVFMPPRQPTTSYLVHAYLHSLPYTADVASFFAFLHEAKIHLAMAGIGARSASTDSAAFEKVLDVTMAIECNPTRQREPRMMIVHKCDATLMDWIGTRVAMGTRIDHLVLEEAFTDVRGLERRTRQAKWQLLGRALGDPGCSRALKVLSLAAMTEITAIDVATLKDALEAPRDTVERTVTLARDSQVRLPTGRVVSVETLASHEFQVVGDGLCGGDWMPVHVPHKGICEVQCWDIIDATTSATIEKSGTSTLDTLDVGCADGRADAILALVDCFGGSLRQLSIHIWFDPRMSSANWTTLLQACPQLEMLELTNVTVRNLGVFSDAYHDRHGGTRVQMLSLTNAMTSDASLKRFVAKLADTTHPMARTLRQFRYVDAKLRDLKMASNRPSPATVKSLLPMLKTNKTLEYLGIGLVPALFRRYGDRFRFFHGEKLPGIPMDRKLALLSVLVPIRDLAAPRHTLPAMCRRGVKRIARRVWAFLAVPLRQELSLVEITEIEEEEDGDDDDDDDDEIE